MTTGDIICPERVWRGGDWNGGWEACGRTVKRRGLCGLHANVADRADARAESSAAARTARDEAQSLADRLTAARGFVKFAALGNQIVLSIDDTRALLTHLESS